MSETREQGQQDGQQRIREGGGGTDEGRIIDWPEWKRVKRALAWSRDGRAALRAALLRLNVIDGDSHRDHGGVFTHKDQPDDTVECWRLGEACRRAADEPKCGDYIDRGLILLRELQVRGYGVVKLADTESSGEGS